MHVGVGAIALSQHFSQKYSQFTIQVSFCLAILHFAYPRRDGQAELSYGPSIYPSVCLPVCRPVNVNIKFKLNLHSEASLLRCSVRAPNSKISKSAEKPQLRGVNFPGAITSQRCAVRYDTLFALETDRQAASLI